MDGINIMCVKIFILMSFPDFMIHNSKRQNIYSDICCADYDSFK